MPWIVSRTTPAPSAAMITERCATSADSAELRDTCSMLDAISPMRSEAEVIWLAWWPAASASCIAVAWVSWVDTATLAEVSLMVVTRWRSSSTA